MLQIDALVTNKPIPLVPEFVGLAAIHARFGSQKIGDCMFLSLMAMARGGKEHLELAEYLWTIARGGSAGPAPELQTVELCSVAEEVRCLAEPSVGGIRMVSTVAQPSTEDNSGS